MNDNHEAAKRAIWNQVFLATLTGTAAIFRGAQEAAVAKKETKVLALMASLVADAAVAEWEVRYPE